MSKINFVISTLILSDLFVFFSLGLLTPIFGVFVLTTIEGSTLQVVGTAVAVYWFARVIGVIPISRLFDRLKGEKDEYYAVVVGSYGLALLPLLYLVATEPIHIYGIEFAKGLASALAIPAWRILFTKFVDRKLIGLEWSFEDVSVGIATAASAFLGALIANTYGYSVLFVVISLAGTIGATLLVKLYRERKIRESHDGVLAFLAGSGTNEPAPLKIDGIK